MKSLAKKLHITAFGVAVLSIFSLTFANSGSNRTCEFVIIMPSFNNEKYVKENLDSVCWQESTNPYHIYYINDCSTDATGKLVEEYIQINNLQDRFTLINNPVNIGGGATFITQSITIYPTIKLWCILTEMIYSRITRS